MASGKFNLTRTGSTSSYITFTCYWSSSSNGSVANSSNLNVQIIASKSSASNSATWGIHNTSATANGSTQSNSSSFSLSPGASITLLNKTFTIPHNSDGTKKIIISVNVGGDVMWANGSTNVTLDTIPRESSVSVANYNLGQNLSIVVGKKNSSFLSTLTYKIGTRTGTIISKTSDSNYVWEMPIDLIEQIKTNNPTNKNVTAIVYCETYSDDEKIGNTTSATFNLTIVDKPIINSINITETVSKITELTSSLVKYLSIPQFNINSSLDTGTTIENYKVISGDKEKTSTENNFTMSNIQYSYLNDNNETKTKFIFNITDSRGNISDNFEVECDFIEYVKLAYKETDIKFTRETSISNVIFLSLSGYIYNGYINQTPNNLIVKYRYKLKDDSSATWSEYQEISSFTINEDNTFLIDNYQFSEEFNYQENYNIEIVISDLFSSEKYESIIKTSDTIFKWHKNGLDVKSLTIQKEEVVSVVKSAGRRSYSDGFFEYFRIRDIGTINAGDTYTARVTLPSLKNDNYHSIQSSVIDGGSGWENIKVMVGRELISDGNYQLKIQCKNSSSVNVENIKISYYICGYKEE